MAKTSQKGMALAIFMPNPRYLLVVKGRKFEDMIIAYARSYARELPNYVRDALAEYAKIWANKKLPERVQFMRSRNAYCCVRDWVRGEGEKRADVPDAKRDKLALVGGGIFDNEFVDYPDTYGEFALVREAVEESRLVVVDEKTRQNLFYLINRYWEQDRERPRGNITYENLVYWVNEARSATVDENGFPAPGDRGVQGETFAAFYLEVDRITPDNFHRKHGHIVRNALRKKVQEENGHIYRPALEHFEQHFPGELYSLHKEKQELEITEPEISPALSDAEALARAMEGVTPLAR